MGYHLANGEECWELLWLLGLENILVALDEKLVLSIKKTFTTGILKELAGQPSDEGIRVSIPVNYLAVSRP